MRSRGAPAGGFRRIAHHAKFAHDGAGLVARAARAKKRGIGDLAAAIRPARAAFTRPGLAETAGRLEAGWDGNGVKWQLALAAVTGPARRGLFAGVSEAGGLRLRGEESAAQRCRSIGCGECAKPVKTGRGSADAGAGCCMPTASAVLNFACNSLGN